jgi:hypothetical protein
VHTTGVVEAPRGQPNVGATVKGFVRLRDDDAVGAAGITAACPNPDGMGMGMSCGIIPKKGGVCALASALNAAELEPTGYDTEGGERRLYALPKAPMVGWMLDCGIALKAVV